MEAFLFHFSLLELQKPTLAGPWCQVPWNNPWSAKINGMISQTTSVKQKMVLYKSFTDNLYLATSYAMEAGFE